MAKVVKTVVSKGLLADLGYTKKSFLKTTKALLLYSLTFSSLYFVIYLVSSLTGADRAFLNKIQTTVDFCGVPVLLPLNSNKYLLSGVFGALAGAVAIYLYRELYLKKIKAEEAGKTFVRLDGKTLTVTALTTLGLTALYEATRVINQSMKEAIKISSFGDRTLIISLFAILILIEIVNRAAGFVKSFLTYSDTSSCKNRAKADLWAGLLAMLPAAALTAIPSLFFNFYLIKKIGPKLDFELSIPIGGERLVLLSNKNNYLLISIVSTMISAVFALLIGTEIQSLVSVKLQNRWKTASEPNLRHVAPWESKKFLVKLLLVVPYSILISTATVSCIQLNQSILDLRSKNPLVWLTWSLLGALVGAIATIGYYSYSEFMRNWRDEPRVEETKGYSLLQKNDKGQLSTM